jgi:hypothetical protein
MKAIQPTKFMSIEETLKPYNTIGLTEFFKIMKDFDVNLYPLTVDDTKGLKSSVFA